MSTLTTTSSVYQILYLSHTLSLSLSLLGVERGPVPFYIQKNPKKHTSALKINLAYERGAVPFFVQS